MKERGKKGNKCFTFLYFFDLIMQEKKVAFGKQLKAFISLWNNVEVFNYIFRENLCES